MLEQEQKKMNHLTQTHVHQFQSSAGRCYFIYLDVIKDVTLRQWKRKRKKTGEETNKGQIRQGVYKRKVTINETKAGSLRESIKSTN